MTFIIRIKKSTFGNSNSSQQFSSVLLNVLFTGIIIGIVYGTCMHVASDMQQNKPLS